MDYVKFDDGIKMLENVCLHLIYPLNLMSTVINGFKSSNRFRGDHPCDNDYAMLENIDYILFCFIRAGFFDGITKKDLFDKLDKAINMIQEAGGRKGTKTKRNRMKSCDGQH